MVGAPGHPFVRVAPARRTGAVPEAPVAPGMVGAHVVGWPAVVVVVVVVVACRRQ